jgi:hypothetical protein
MMLGAFNASSMQDAEEVTEDTRLLQEILYYRKWVFYLENKFQVMNEGWDIFTNKVMLIALARGSKIVGVLDEVERGLGLLEEQREGHKEEGEALIASIESMARDLSRALELKDRQIMESCDAIRDAVDKEESLRERLSSRYISYTPHHIYVYIIHGIMCIPIAIYLPCSNVTNVASCLSS